MDDCIPQPCFQLLLHLISHHIVLMVDRGLQSPEKVSVNYRELTPSTLSHTFISRTQGQLLRLAHSDR